MKKMSTFAVVLSLAVTFAWVTAAQEASSGSASVPKVLQITREFIKPGKAGLVHDKSEVRCCRADGTADKKLQARKCSGVNDR